MRGGSVKGSDVTAAMFAESGSKDIETMEYTLKPIIFVVPKGAPAGLVDQRRREAEAFRGRFAGCDAVVEQARQLKEVVVRSTIRRTSEELAGSPEGQDIQETPPGKVTRPQKSEEGYMLLAVCTAKSIQSNAAATRPGRSQTGRRAQQGPRQGLHGRASQEGRHRI